MASAKFGGIVMVRIEGGKIVESWNHFDFLTMYKQIGYDLVEKIRFKSKAKYSRTMQFKKTEVTTA
jgi:hypothetical protein